MTRSLSFSTVLLAIILLMCAGSMSARTGGTFVLSPGSASQPKGVASAVNPSQILNIWANLYTGGSDGYRDKEQDNDRDRDKYKEKDKYKYNDNNPHAPSPNPEPSTLLSFGAALLIGGGVLYSRRLRRNRK